MMQFVSRRQLVLFGVLLLSLGAVQQTRASTRDGGAPPDFGASVPNSPPSIASLSPQSGSDRVGAKRTFTLVASDANGASDIQEMWLLINTRLNWSEGATLIYKPSAVSPSSGQLYLRRGDEFLPPLQIGDGATPDAVLDNGVVRIVGSDVRVGTAGGRISLTLPLTIRDGLVGKNNLYSYVQDREGAVDPAGTTDHYRVFGAYTVISQFKDWVNDAPTLSRLTPTSANTTLNSQGTAAAAQNFGFSVSDEDGTGDIESVSFTVGRANDVSISTTFVYMARTRRLYLLSYDGHLTGGGQIGTGVLLENRQVRLDVSKAKVLIYPGGKSFGLILPLQAKSKLLGQNKVWLRVQDTQTATAPNGDARGYVLSGTWNVNQNPPPAAQPSPSSGHS